MKKREREYIYWRKFRKGLRYNPFENIPVSAAFIKAFDGAIKEEFNRLQLIQKQKK